MKTILIATDFSEASRNAAVFGLELAKAFDSKVILVSAYMAVPVPLTETPAIIIADDMNKYTQQQLQMEEKFINANGKVTVETICKNGPAVQAILDAAKQKKAGLIVVGMKEGDKGMRKLLGSTATALARKTSVPLLIVPEKAKFTGISSIALANESDVEPDADPRLLESLQEIATKFRSKVYLVRVAKDQVKAGYETLNRPFKLIRMMPTLDTSYGAMEGRSIPEALNHFIEGYHINMLAMLPHKHSLLERWFVKSTTRSVVFEAHIPLLILPDLHIEMKG